MRPVDLYRRPNALAGDYTRFRVAERLLFTGHSHQAWPDCGFAAVGQAWLDAAEFVDDKWDRAFAQADRVMRGYARLLGEPDADVALGQNTLELAVRFLSALPFASRPRLVSTDGEFHTIRRLLDRLVEAEIEVVRVAAEPTETLVERLSAAVDDRTAAVLCSTVLFRSARIVSGLPELASACAKHGAELLLDAYHQMNVVPFDPTGLQTAYIVGGGYKYCQLGEGVCFLRVPKNSTLRPITTGWFTEFDALARPSANNPVGYGRGGMRFGGATFDPTSVYRAAATFEFFEQRGLTPELLREVSQHQIRLLVERFDALDLDPHVIDRDRATPLDRIGGFLALRSRAAGEICARLKSFGVAADSRGDTLRFGPAPYLCDEQILEAVDRLGAACRGTTLNSAGVIPGIDRPVTCPEWRRDDD
jgi:kynureninase